MTGTRHIINASAHQIPLPSGMFHTVCTSPPYYSLRKYSGAQAIGWPSMEYTPMPGLASLAIPAMSAPLGLEPTPEAFIGHLVLCFREVWRVMRDDGVAWLNLGDSYTSSGGPEPMQTKWRVDGASNTQCGGESRTSNKPGDLMLIPHRVALALQADGWTVRGDVVWAKVAPMPESVSGWAWTRCRVKVKNGIEHSGGTRGNAGGTFESSLHTPGRYAEWQTCPGCPRCAPNDGYVLRRGSWRHTRSHEYVFMLSKGMGYFANGEAVREENSPTSHTGGAYQDPWKMEAIGHGSSTSQMRQGVPIPRNGRNPRDVLTPSPRQFKGAHYAVYPDTLISPLLQATAPTRVCRFCGAPWAVMVEKGEPIDRPDNPNPVLPYDATSGHNNGTGATTLHKIVSSNVTGYRQTCTCPPHDPAPGWVLDPFVGSGTTLAVCAELGVNAVGIDTSPAYLDEHVKPRIGQTPSGALDDLPMFARLMG